ERSQEPAEIPGTEQVRAPDRWGEVFGDDVVAAAMIDRLVHHAEVISLKGDSYRLKNRDLGRVPAADPSNDQ
ncbi:ATP-binding protein, partial [Streptosporangium lutulentum]|uniref:ATP-binding protein n=1 Tax=Streptosporangium lutulentum TaxID=1461250 RepID=UPI0036266CAC